MNKTSQPQIAKVKRPSRGKDNKVRALKNAFSSIASQRPIPVGTYEEQDIAITVRGAESKDVKTLYIKPRLLFRHSPYFRTLLKGRNGRPKTYEHEDLTLDGDGMHHFAVYCSKGTFDGFHVPPMADGADVLREMVDLYVLAEQLQVTTLMNLAVTKTARLAQKHGALVYRLESVNKIYERYGEKDHPLRRYIVDLYAGATDSEIKKILPKRALVPRDFLHDLILARSPLDDDPNLHPQRYHQKVIVEVSDDEEEIEEGGNVDPDPDEDSLFVPRG